MSANDWQALTARIAEQAAGAGLDLACAFEVTAYNALAAASEQLPAFERESALGLLVGNTRRLWPAFVRAYAEEPQLQSARHPLDHYVSQRLRAIAAALPCRSELILSHVTEPRAFPMQRLAERVGLGALSPSHLLIHAQHGPWVALRAALVLDAPGPGLHGKPAPSPCTGCSAPCLAALERARAATGEPLTSAGIAAHASDWIAVRDACPVGRGSRYGDAQLAYHYAPSATRIKADSPRRA